MASFIDILALALNRVPCLLFRHSRFSHPSFEAAASFIPQYSFCKIPCFPRDNKNYVWLYCSFGVLHCAGYLIIQSARIISREIYAISNWGYNDRHRKTRVPRRRKSALYRTRVIPRRACASYSSLSRPRIAVLRSRSRMQLSSDFSDNGSIPLGSASPSVDQSHQTWVFLLICSNRIENHLHKHIKSQLATIIIRVRWYSIA